MSGRCRACDAILEPHELAWDDERKEHEDMCYVCRGIVATSEHEEVLSIYIQDTYDDFNGGGKT